MVHINKNITNRDFLMGDLDRDGTKDIDDRYPLNPKIKQPVSEIKLSNELSELKKVAKSYKIVTFGLYKHIKSKGYKVKYRIKNVNSMINKLRRKGFAQGLVQDVGGILILVNTKEELYNAAKFIKSHYKVVAEDDYMKKPLSGYYFALHYTVEIDGKYIEIQLKHKKHSRIHKRVHEQYKTGKLTPEIIKQYTDEVNRVKW